VCDAHAEEAELIESLCKALDHACDAWHDLLPAEPDSVVIYGKERDEYDPWYQDREDIDDYRYLTRRARGRAS